MKGSLFILGCFLSLQIHSQNQDSLIATILVDGARNYEEGRYDLALMEYNRALAIDRKHALANYEIAMCYYSVGNDKSALSHANVASKDQSEVGIEATILVGGIIDHQGKSKKAMKTFKKGIDRFGDYFLLWYHYGISATAAGDFEEASIGYQKAMSSRLDHVDSHFALARLMLSQDRLVESIYPLMFFLMLEPRGDASIAAVNSLNKALNETQRITEVSNKRDKNKDVNFQMANLLMSAFADARRLQEYSEMSELEIDEQVLSRIFEFMETSSPENDDSFYSNYYFPFFHQIAENGYLMTLLHYISQSVDEPSALWVEQNTEQIEKMFVFLDEIDVN